MGWVSNFAGHTTIKFIFMPQTRKPIELENEFQSFIDKRPSISTRSASNYRTWLRFIASLKIDLSKSIPLILGELRADAIATGRVLYTTNDDYSNFGSALSEYHIFLSQRVNDVSIDLDDILNDTKKSVTEKQQQILARMGQGEFRKGVIALWEGCSVTGFKNIELLVASHIYPWKPSNDEERLNPKNGLLLLPNYDKLFDKGYISFSNDKKIICSKLITDSDYQSLGIKKTDSLRFIDDDIIHFLEKHRMLYKEKLGKF
jgi:putative restriction endonuclease